MSWKEILKGPYDTEQFGRKIEQSLKQEFLNWLEINVDSQLKVAQSSDAKGIHMDAAGEYRGWIVYFDLDVLDDLTEFVSKGLDLDSIIRQEYNLSRVQGGSHEENRTFNEYILWHRPSFGDLKLRLYKR
jgi:hypothetical protein